MRTSEIVISPEFSLTAEVPNSVVFMYSPQVIRLTCNSSVVPASASVTVKSNSNYQRHTETRDFGIQSGTYTVYFEIGRIMRLLASDVRLLTQRLNKDSDYYQDLTEIFDVSVTVTASNGVVYDLFGGPLNLRAFYGALDQCEEYGGTERKRLWLNYPQTFTIWKDVTTSVFITIGGETITPWANPENYQVGEFDMVARLKELGKYDTLASFKPGTPVAATMTWGPRIKFGHAGTGFRKNLFLTPDDTALGEGTYLRWLNRHGGMSYWLFVNSSISVAAKADKAVEKPYNNDPTVPSFSLLMNSRSQSFRESREIVLGAVGVTNEEFEDLCGLATSPVVDRLILPEYEGEYIWQRVNVLSGTFERNIRRNTPSLQDFEVVIELPERNTIKI